MADENVFLLHAFLLGIFVTFVYDLLRIFRRVVKHGTFAVSLEDLGFWIFCAIEVFLLMYRESNGTLRWFAVAGALLGIWLYHKTVSGPFVKGIAGILQKLAAFLEKLAGKIRGGFQRRIGSRGKRFSAFFKKRLTAPFKMLRIVIKKR